MPLSATAGLISFSQIRFSSINAGARHRRQIIRPRHRPATRWVYPENSAAAPEWIGDLEVDQIS
jgi:hypothetical protein